MPNPEPLQEIVVKPGHIIVGQVIDGHIHVADIIHEGVSEVGLTGSKPALTPIPIEKIEVIRKTYGLNEPIEAVKE